MNMSHSAVVIRLETMHNHLKARNGEAEKLLRPERDKEVKEDEILRIFNLLESSNSRFISEIHQHMDKNSEVLSDKIGEYTTSQLEAESWMAEIKTYRTQLQSMPFLTTKLPKMDLPKFYGEVTKFYEFWDRFEASVDKQNLSDADKLAYLLSSLEGTAKETVAGFNITNANYTIVKDTLIDKFGKKNIIIDAHYEALNKMKRALNIRECRNNLNEIERNLRILESLGEDVNGNQFRAILTNKFPDDILYELHVISGEKTMSSIRKGLEHIITAKELSRNEQNLPEELMTSGATTALYAYNIIPKKGHQSKMSGNNRKNTPSHSKMTYIKSKPESNSTKQSIQNKPTFKRKFPNSNQVPIKKGKRECIFCCGEHYNSDCTVVKGAKERKLKLKDRCYRCFRSGHRSRACTSRKRPCYNCQGDHNQALCPSLSKNSNNLEKTKDETLCYVTKTSLNFLQTATVTVKAPHRQTKCRIILDCGSQRSYITERLARKLQIQNPHTNDTLMIYVFGSNSPVETLSPATNLTIITRRNIERDIRVNIVPKITDKVPPPSELNEITNMDVIADDSTEDQNIDLLIGNDYYISFLRNKIIKIKESLYGMDSDFGWLVSGKQVEDMEKEICTLSVVTYCQFEPGPTYYTVPDLPLKEADMKFLWALECLGIVDSPKSTREEEAIRQFNESVKFENHRYYVTWPWILYPPELDTNYGLAYGRLNSLIRRLDKITLNEYNTILQEQLDAGVIEIIEPQPNQIYQTTPPIHYLPHHIVMHEGKRGRVVYDGSASVKGRKSLNECMYRGPAMLEDLTALLLQFRINKIGLTADIEKAFLQIALQEEARDVTRFLWLKNLNEEFSENNVIHLRFCRVPFGIISSPFILTATIRHHLARKDNTLLKQIADRCYVDNLLTGSSNKVDALKLVSSTIDTFSELSMNIRDWVSNDEKVMNEIPPRYKGKCEAEIKVLGLMWNTKKDTLRLKNNVRIEDQENGDQDTTKRGILRTLASLYDPCGFAAPLILPAKLILQELWKRKVKWDTSLPDDLREQWETALKALRAAKEIEIPRYLGDTTPEMNYCELHCFTDASQNAYAAVVYLRITNKKTKESSIKFLMAKARITPIEYKEELKIPRLELLGYVIGKRLLIYVEQTLELKIEGLYLWTDSAIVLYWMKSEKLLPPFVSRRVAEIKQKGKVQYKFVDGNQNPADLATRPELWETKRKLWFGGPEFLRKDITAWPVLPTQNTFCATALAGLDFNPETEMNNFEEVNELYETNAENNEQIYDERVPQVHMVHDNKNQGEQEIEELRSLQERYFPDERTKETHLTRNLLLFLDSDGLLRCKGRIMNAHCSYDTKYPILLPRDCEFTDELIQKTHEKNYHVGASHTLSIIRQKYWIPQGKAKVQRVLKRCHQCTKHGGGPYKLPPAPALPSQRVNYSAPFTFTGIDYFGPLFVLNNQTAEKRWVCLYTCLAVRAIHMEVVNDLSAEECLLALRRFIAVRGLPDIIVSDNALQFKLSAEVLTSAYCKENRIRWKFIPELSPWHGGFYERLVGLAKRSLKRTLEKQSLNDNQLQTVIKEVEVVLNTRPLTSVGADIEYVLRPADFLTLGKNIDVTPSFDNTEPGGTVTKRNLIEGWKRGQTILEEFKRMFIGQYLLSLRERYQHSHKQPRVLSPVCPQVGDFVLLKGESKNRENWKTGRIMSLLPSLDGEHRVAKVLVEGKEFTRSLGHLYPLEVEDTGSNGGNITEGEVVKTYPASVTNTQVLAPTPPIFKDQVSVETMSTLPVETHDNYECSQPEREHQNKEVTEEENKEPETEAMEVVQESTRERTVRAAAQKAKEQIAEWTRQLIAIL